MNLTMTAPVTDFEQQPTYLLRSLMVDSPTKTRVRGTRGESTSRFPFFRFFLLNSVSPVLCLERELRPVVHFDGELLMVSFVVYYLQ